MATDHYLAARRGDLSPATRAVAVTPSDTTLIDPVPRALYIGGAGNLVIDTMGGDVNILLAVAGGTLLPIRATRIKAATTATGIVAIS